MEIVVSAAKNGEAHETYVTIHYGEEQQIPVGTGLSLVPLDNCARAGILDGIVGSQGGGSTVPDQTSGSDGGLEDRAVLEPPLDLVGGEHAEGPGCGELFTVRAGLSDLEVES